MNQTTAGDVSEIIYVNGEPIRVRTKFIVDEPEVKYVEVARKVLDFEPAHKTIELLPEKPKKLMAP